MFVPDSDDEYTLEEEEMLAAPYEASEGFTRDGEMTIHVAGLSCFQHFVFEQLPSCFALTSKIAVVDVYMLSVNFCFVSVFISFKG